MWITLFITSGLTLSLVETAGKETKMERSELPLVAVHKHRESQCWHKQYCMTKRMRGRDTKLVGENEKVYKEKEYKNANLEPVRLRKCWHRPGKGGLQREREISHSNLVCYYSLGIRAGMKTAIHHCGNTVKEFPALPHHWQAAVVPVLCVSGEKER